MNLSKETAWKRLKTVLTSSETERIVLSTNSFLTVTVDVHGLTRFQAKRLISNIINIIHCFFKMVVIHGYNHGTTIKDMLFNTTINSHISKQYYDFRNQGVTYMDIVA